MTYELINWETTNTLASFETLAEARTAQKQYEAMNPALTFAICTFDDEGLCLDRR
jgi:hypothetical protein